MTTHSDVLPDLPHGWAWTTLGEVTDSTSRRVEPANFAHLEYIGLEHVQPHSMQLIGSVPASTMKSISEYFSPGDILYGRLRPYLNKVFRAEFEGLCSAEFIPFRKVAHLHNKYLQYFLNSWDFVSFATHLNEGDRPRVNLDQLSEYPFPLPPLPEQERIVAAIEAQLTRIDAGVAALRQAQARLKRYRAAVLKAACAGRLAPQDPADEPASALLERILAERYDRWADGERARGKLPVPSSYKAPAAPDVDGLPALPSGWAWATVEQLIIRIRSGSSAVPVDVETPFPILRHS